MLKLVLVACVCTMIGCRPPPSEASKRCAARGYETGYAKYLGDVCVERRPDGMGVVLVLPNEPEK